MRRKKCGKLTKNNCPISDYVNAKSNANRSIKVDRNKKAKQKKSHGQNCGHQTQQNRCEIPNI
ncbi:hypothetical protein AYI69_g11430, partial [Smittium culicis]